jgi:hypothetical protein
MYSSSDFGVTWKTTSLASIMAFATPQYEYLYIKVVFTGTKYLLYVPTDPDWYSTNGLFSSTNLTTWTAVTTPFSSNDMNLVVFNNKLLAISRLVTNGYYYSSDEGTTWSAKVQYLTNTTMADRLHHYKIYNNKLFLCGGIINAYTGHHFATYTSDGITWNNITLTNDTIRPAVVTEMIEFKQKLYFYTNGIVPSRLYGGLTVNRQIIEYDDLTRTTKIIKIHGQEVFQGDLIRFIGGGLYEYPLVQIQDYRRGGLGIYLTGNADFTISYTNKLVLTFRATHEPMLILNESTGEFEPYNGLRSNPDICKKINSKFVVYGDGVIYFTDPTKFPYFCAPQVYRSGSVTHIRTK